MFADDEIDFTKCKTVEEAFTLLITELQDNIPEYRLKYIKNSCVQQTNRKFLKCIKTRETVSSFFTLLLENKLHCNWINIHLLKHIVIASKVKELQKLIDKYEAEIHSKTLRQVWEYIPQLEFKKSKYYKKIKAKFDSKTPDVTVAELFECSRKLASKVAIDLIRVRANCLEITWVVPTDKVYELFLFALTIPQQSRQDDILQIGAWTVYHPQLVLEELKMKFG